MLAIKLLSGLHFSMGRCSWLLQHKYAGVLSLSLEFANVRICYGHF